MTQDYDYPAYGRLNRAGFTRTTVTNINSQVGLNLDMSFLTKGLSLSGVFAYQTNANGYHITTQSYEKYRRTDDYDVLEFVRKGSDIDTPLSVGKGSTEYYHLDGIVHLDYAAGSDGTASARWDTCFTRASRSNTPEAGPTT